MKRCPQTHTLTLRPTAPLGGGEPAALHPSGVLVTVRAHVGRAAAAAVHNARCGTSHGRYAGSARSRHTALHLCVAKNASMPFRPWSVRPYTFLRCSDA